MNKLIVLLQGKKTKINAVVLALYAVLKAFEVIVVTPEQNSAILVLFAAIFAITIHSAITRK